MRKRSEAFFLAAVLFGPILVLANAESAARECGCTTPRPSVVSRIVNGTNVADSQFPTVGQIGDTSFNFCTGTLISAHHVLSAAHCVTDDRGKPNLDAAQAHFRLGGVDYKIAQIVVHPSYDGNIDTEGVIDLSILVLQQDVPNVKPSALFRNTPSTGTVLTLAGYGVEGTGDKGVTDNSPTPRDGTIDYGTTPIDLVTSTYIKWNFDNKPAPNTESNTAPGDSGGPAFITVSGELLLAGVTSGGSNDNAGYGDQSFDTRVDAALAWIDSIVPPSGNGNPGGNNGTPSLTIASGPTATPNPAAVLENVDFVCTASDSTASVSWDFGDGSASAAGSSVSHAFSQSGTYTVRVTASAGGLSTNASLNMQVNSTADESLTVSRAHFVLNFRNAYGSSLDFRVSHPDFQFADRFDYLDAFDGQSISVLVGSKSLDELDIYGTRAFGQGTLNWNVIKGELSFRIRSDLLPGILDAYGAHNETTKSLVSVPLTLRLGGKQYRGNYMFSYKARANSTGTGR